MARIEASAGGRQAGNRKYKRNELLGGQVLASCVSVVLVPPSVIGVLAAHSMVHKSVVNYSNADN